MGIRHPLSLALVVAASYTVVTSSCTVVTSDPVVECRRMSFAFCDQFTTCVEPAFDASECMRVLKQFNDCSNREGSAEEFTACRLALPDAACSPSPQPHIVLPSQCVDLLPSDLTINHVSANCGHCADISGFGDVFNLCPASQLAWSDLVTKICHTECVSECGNDWCARLLATSYTNASLECNQCVIDRCSPELAACSNAM